MLYPNFDHFLSYRYIHGDFYTINKS